MADVIHKYGPITPDTGWFTVKGEPVHVGIQGGQTYVWCRKSDGQYENPELTVGLVATGEPYNGKYIGTVIYNEFMFPLVYHLIKMDI